ncbi:MAG: hypothetical protein HKN16_11300 [Saprospiraceae bacterium]|nr:hypothetical protein [Saprospiraceae bacterium]
MTKFDWEELEKTLLLGTGRHPLSQTLITSARILGINLDQSEEHILMDLALASSTLRRTALQFPCEELPLERDKTKQHQPCPPYFSKLLLVILEKDWIYVLEEFQRQLKKNNWSLPGHLAPPLFEKAVLEPSFWETVKPLLLPRFQWLILENPRWQQLHEGANDKGLSPQRFGILRTKEIVLANNPLLEIWDELSVIGQLKYLKVILDTPLAEDEAFLEACWNTKKKKVRQKLFEIWLNIPQSNLQTRKDHIFPKLIGKKKKIDLPDLSQEELEELKVLPLYLPFKGGLKANRLAQILAGTSWIVWKKELEITNENFAAWLGQQKWKEQIIIALLQIVSREKEPALRFMLFRYFHSWDEELPKNIDLLFKGISQEEFSRFSQWSFLQGVTILTYDDIYVRMSLTYKKPWPNQITFGFFKLVKQWLRESPKYWEGWHTMIIRHLSFFADPRQADRIRLAFQQDASWVLIEDELESFLKILNFRKQLYLEDNEE